MGKAGGDHPVVGVREEICRAVSIEHGAEGVQSHQVLGPQIIKEKYQFSDKMTVDHIAMNPYLQYFIGLTGYRQRHSIQV